MGKNGWRVASAELRRIPILRSVGGSAAPARAAATRLLQPAIAQAMHELEAMKATNAELSDENAKLLQEMLVGRTSEAEQLMATAERLAAARWSLDREISQDPGSDPT